MSQPNPTVELLQNAIDYANVSQKLPPDPDTDLASARGSLDADDLDNVSDWGLIVIGYVAVAMRGGRR